MISSTKKKLIRSLQKKKYRALHGLFVVEGEKMVRELLEEGRNRYQAEELFATAQWLEENSELLSGMEMEIQQISRKEMEGISGMVSPQEVLILAKLPAQPEWPTEKNRGPVLAFDAIRDPGNLGTIIRTADWFGIDSLLLSRDSVDLYNTKVVQSSMGSITRTKVYYVDLEKTLEEMVRSGSKVFGTFISGEDLYSTKWEKNPVILFGNEARGISSSLSGLVSHRLTIPSFRPGSSGPESLNLASSVAVICSEMKRATGS